MDIKGLSVDAKVYSPPQVEKVASEQVEITNSGNETKKQYLELAVGEKEKELKRLGLKGEEDGKVTLKKEETEQSAWSKLREENLEAQETEAIEKKKAKKEEIKEEEEKEAEKEEEEKENGECETCANRKYQDGSDEMVSFKSAAHIAPEAAASRVRAHEQEHVNNAYEKAELKDGKVQFASIAIHTSICPECGRTYVSGGTTTTTIRYNNDDYASNAKKQDATVVSGMNVDEMG